MCILLKLYYAKFGVSSLFFEKLLKKDLWRSARTPPPPVKEGLKRAMAWNGYTSNLTGPEIFFYVS